MPRAQSLVRDQVGHGLANWRLRYGLNMIIIIGRQKCARNVAERGLL
jgi:hypothetical protein